MSVSRYISGLPGFVGNPVYNPFETLSYGAYPLYGAPGLETFGGIARGSAGANGASAATKTSAAVPVKTEPDGSTLVGLSGGLQFHLFWDSSVSSAPAGFKSAAIAAAGFYTQMYANSEVINIHVGWGEVDGIPLGATELSASVRPGLYQQYASVYGALMKDAGYSSFQAQADSTLPTTDPLGAQFYYVPYAEAKTLGFLSSAGTETDGYVGMSSSFPVAFTQPTAAGKYDALGALEHEISEVMGRIGAVGSAYGAGVYTPLDLFRYSTPGVRAASTSAPSPYFSIDGGKTDLGNFSKTSDYADWVNTVRGDAYGDATLGTTLSVTSNDLIANAVLGYKFTAAGLAAAQA